MYRDRTLKNPRHVTAQFPGPLADRLDAVADRDGVTRSEALRAATRIFVDLREPAEGQGEDS